MITSFDIWDTKLPYLEVYGTLGSLSISNPDYFDGPVYYRSYFSEEFKELPLVYPYRQNSRGIGVADMAAGISSGRMHKANGQNANHVLEVMEAFEKSSNTKCFIKINSPAVRPDTLRLGLIHGMVE